MKSGETLLQMEGKDVLLGLLEGALYTAGAACLCYRSWFGLLPGCVLIPVFLIRRKKKVKERRKGEISRQFITAMHTVSGALMAGYSMENAWKHARLDMEKVYGKDGMLPMEFRRMEQRMQMNEPLEPLLLGFARKTGVEDIHNFAEIFRHAKRSGGNMAEIIRVTVSRMQEKSVILEEIENAIASKRMEQKMMNLMLPGILLFVTVSSPEYVDSLYHNPLGIAVMTVSLCGYFVSCFWSEKITDIPV